ncbi:MAG: DinB family protein [Candidatus Kariarchaeaceae archaeon]|jgi:uncharacterized damage-inducible protein DinB
MMEIFQFLIFSVKEEHKSLGSLLDRLSDADLQTEMGGDTLGNRFKHIIDAEHRMAGYLFVKQDEVELNIGDITVNNLRDASIKSKLRHIETLKNLSMDDLDKNWISEKSGNSYSYKWLLYHFLEHLSTHRGQIAHYVNLIKPNA